MALTLQEYSDRAYETAMYKDKGNNLIYAVLGLTGEAGELAEKLKKIVRKEGVAHGPISEEIKLEMIKELGDVLWYVSGCARELGCSLEDVARLNIEKLASRKERGVVHGSGDNR